MENTSVGPGVEIFECVTKLSVEEIKSKLPQHIVAAAQDGTKVFIIKTNSEAWAGFAQGIVIQ